MILGTGLKNTKDEIDILRSQFATLNKKINNGTVDRKYLPYVFTEQGIAMPSGLLKNDVAIYLLLLKKMPN